MGNVFVWPTLFLKPSKISGLGKLQEKEELNRDIKIGGTEKEMEPPPPRTPKILPCQRQKKENEQWGDGR